MIISKGNIYPARSQEVVEKFEKNLPKEILVIPLDMAKKSHKMQICFGDGTFLLNKAITIQNNLLGLEYMIKCIEKAAFHNKIRRENIIIGTEDLTSYSINFVHMIASRGFLFVRVSALEAKKNRSNNRASSDEIDLTGIAQTIINRRAFELSELSSIYVELKYMERRYENLKRTETAEKNRIHQLIDRLIPDFLDENKSGLTAFSKVSLFFMEKGLSIQKIKKMQKKTLLGKLKSFSVTHPEEKVKKLKDFIKTIVPPTLRIELRLSKNLEQSIQLFKALQNILANTKEQISKLLLQTPGFYLTSMPGMGVIRTSVIMGELGDPITWKTIDQIASYAGIVCNEKQTGGDSKPARKGKLPKNCNHRLKNHLIQAGFNSGRLKHPVNKTQESLGKHRLYRHYQRINIIGGKSNISTAKMILKIGKKMIEEKRVYMPDIMMEKVDFDNLVDPEMMINYYISVDEKLDRIWSKVDTSDIPEKNNYYLLCKKDLESKIAFYKNDFKKFY